MDNKSSTTNHYEEKVTDVAKIRASGEVTVIESAGKILSIVDKIQLWGIDRGITTKNGATALDQTKKLRSELFELMEALREGNRHEVKDGIGDMLVVLVQIARLERLTWNECLEQAWNDIKDRKGQMVCGIFVKEADLKLPGLVGVLNGCTTAQEVEDAIALAKSITPETKTEGKG